MCLPLVGFFSEWMGAVGDKMSTLKPLIQIKFSNHTFDYYIYSASNILILRFTKIHAKCFVISCVKWKILKFICS